MGASGANNPPMRFAQARPFATLGALVAAWLIVPTAIKAFLRASFFDLTAPITVTASHLRDLQEYWGLTLHSKRQLIEAGRDLARVNASYAFSAEQGEELRREIRRLHIALRMPPLPGYRFEAARVAQRDFTSWWQRMVIRKGSDYGIPVGAPVVYSGGVVGRVTEVHADTSVVELISNPGVRLAAFFEGDTRPVSFQGGDNPAFGPARGLLEFVPRDIQASADAPRRLVTSGLGGEFPAGLLIGEVVEVEASPDGRFQTGVVALDPRLSDLTEVTVLVPVPAGSLAAAQIGAP
ncbi:MAG: rod shape-determining protein MreC [Opitutaceae bacterium]